MSVLAQETKLPGFWYELIRLSDSQEKRVELARKIADLISLADMDDMETEECEA